MRWYNVEGREFNRCKILGISDDSCLDGSVEPSKIRVRIIYGFRSDVAFCASAGRFNQIDM
jgi:hypothetical protein